jgi:squalene cyclase
MVSRLGALSAGLFVASRRNVLGLLRVAACLPAVHRAINWLVAMQNSDGGWGAFDRNIDNEVLTDPLGGAALVNGTQVDQNAALLGAVTSIRAAREDNAYCDATFVANGPEIELRVTGDTAETYSWVVEVRQIRN